ncbi:TOG array regulator of axonemal microtubules protein 1-like isoform X1 [Lytechinus variegatus]|uniref:TOG array regulator of axonemal microtubules protein 1-like isoform X1 n=1 Tax=Lytechinus variegatus TaxID=7654 RepID=UPI001BB1ABD0|nr:TOG array regulator of axonemal microtubules protein 1-like isoform X1 [Lytechinus variegatus]
MAGTVAKLPVYNFGQGEHRTVMNGSDADESGERERKMDDEDLFRQLQDSSYVKHREHILDELVAKVRRNGGKVPFKNPRALFKGLALVLRDEETKLRLKCIQFIMDLVPILKQELDACMMLVIPNLISSFSDAKVSMRKAAVQTLHMYMKHTTNIEPIFNSIVNYGLENEDPKIRAETAVSLPVLLTGEFANTDLSIVTCALARKFTDDTDLMATAGVSLDRICSLVGEATFNSYIDSLPARIKSGYCKRTGRPDPSPSVPLEGYSATGSLDWNSNRTTEPKSVPDDERRSRSKPNTELQFGIVPQDVLDQLSDQEHWTERASGVQELKEIVVELQDISELTPHMINFISFLCNLLDDSNFKVSFHTLEIFQELVQKFNQKVKPFIRHIVNALSKRFGDNKTVIRQANMKVMMQLMQSVGPKQVVHVVSELKNQRKSGVREEALNIVIAALLTFPSYDFDLPIICRTLSQCLSDQKRRVRQATLELFAVLAQAMGPTRIGPLIDAVDQIELKTSEEGVMKAVQARLARRQLPRLNEDGLVEYASQTPSSAAAAGRTASSAGHDTEWILKATRNSSAKERAYTDPGIELSQPSPTRAKIPMGNVGNPDSQPPKRFLSAGRGRSKLPWEEVRDARVAEDMDDGQNTTGHGRVQINSAPTQKREEPGLRRPPIKARNTWNGGEDVWDNAKRNHNIGTDVGSDQGSSGSYRQIHLDKLKRASLNTYPGRGRGNLEDEPHPSGSHSAPVTERDLKLWKTFSFDGDDIFGGPDPFVGNTAVIPKKRGSLKQQHSQHHYQEDSDRLALKQQLSYSEKYMPSVGSSRSRNEEEREQRMNRKSLSNSWPDPGIGMDDGPSSSSTAGRKKMDLMLDSVHDFHASSQYDIPSPNKSNLPSGTSPISPIPLKATLARSAGRRGQARAPLVPLEKTTSPRDDYDDLDSYQDTYRSDWTDNDPVPNISSLDNIRGSAAKKRAEKKARGLDKTSSGSNRGSERRSPYSPPRDLDESGVFSLQSTGRLDFEDGLDNGGQTTYIKKKSTSGKKGSDSPFSSKPRMARANSGKGVRRNAGEQRQDGGGSSTNLEFNPSGGVTFRDNATSDVSIIGHGFSNGRGHKDIDLSDNHVASGKGQNSRDRKRTKGSILSPLSMASLQHPGGVDLDDNGALVGEDFAMVIGKGILGNDANIVEYPRSNGGEKTMRRKESHEDGALPEVIGLPVRHDEDSPEENQDLSISLSKATMDRMARKQIEKKEEIELRKAERKAEKERADEERRARDAERQHLQKEIAAQRKEMQEREREQQRLDYEKQQREKERFKEERERQREERMREREEQKREREERLREDRERQRAEREERERQKAERERIREEQQAKARERQREKLKQLELEGTMDHDDGGDLAINGAPLDSSRPSPTNRVISKPPAATPPKKKGSGISVTKNSSAPPQTVTSPPRDDAQSREMKPVHNVDVAIKDSLRFLGHDDWEIKLDGLFIIQRLACFHSNELGGQLHAMVVAVLNEVKNLRSSVARAAISTLGEMFQSCKTSMDKDLDQICRILLPKAGESNGFIREDVDKTLEAMVKNANPQRVLGSLITAGASHKSSMVRKTTSVFLDAVVERMGPGRILSGVKDVTDKILPVTAQLALDNGQETRYYGRKILFNLMHHEDFDRLIEKHVPAKNLKSIKDILENLKNKGLGEVPSDTSSAKARRSNPNSRANSGSQSYSRDRNDYSEMDGTPPSSVKKGKRSSGGVRGEENETIKSLCEGLGASDWMSRLQAIEKLQAMCETNQDMVDASLVRIFDKFISRLSDSNSKVNIAALTTMKDIVPRLGESLQAVVNNLIPILVQNLAAKNPSISQTSNDILDLILEHVDMLVLVQPYSNATQYGNVRARPAMVEKLSYLVTKVYPRKQQTVVRNVLPVLWYLLGNMTGSGAVPGGSGNLRSATGVLANSLYEQMGEVLLQHAHNLPPRNVKTLKELIEEVST